jgi:hypothetical protein
LGELGFIPSDTAAVGALALAVDMVEAVSNAKYGRAKCIRISLVKDRFWSVAVI